MRSGVKRVTALLQSTERCMDKLADEMEKKKGRCDADAH
jgi:hypothetical protein